MKGLEERAPLGLIKEKRGFHWWSHCTVQIDMKRSQGHLLELPQLKPLMWDETPPIHY